MSTTPQSGSSPRFRPTLRLFSTDGHSGDGDGQPTGDMTLSQFWYAYVRPKVMVPRGSAPRNLTQYEQSLGYWERFAESPAIHSIGDDETAKFSAGLRTLRGLHAEPLSTNTIRKHVTHVQAVLDLCGPPTHKRPHNKNLVSLPASIVRPAEVIDEVDDCFTLSELSVWLEACGACRSPRARFTGIPPAVWWQGLSAVVYNSACRIGTAIRLRFSWLTVDELGTWLMVPSGAMKRARRSHRVFCNLALLAVIERMRREYAIGGRAEQDVIFPWPFCETSLHHYRAKMLARSSLAAPRQFGFHAIRKASITQISLINPAAAKLHAGHASRDVTLAHYTHRLVVAETLPKLPQPAWRWVGGERQARLF